MTDPGYGYSHGRKIEGRDWPWQEVKIDPAKLPVIPSPITIVAMPAEARYAESRGKGYTGDPCHVCQQLTLKVSGHCMVCDSCGTTTGCS